MSLISRKARRAAATAVAAPPPLAATARRNSSSDSSSDEGGAMTLWTSVGPGPGLDYMNSAVKAFEAEHDVTIDLKTMPDNELDGALQTALQGGASTAPDIFLQRGGGKLKAMVQTAEPQVMDITDKRSDDAKTLIPESAYGPETVDGKVYAVPVAIQPGGFFYSKDLFAAAGIEKNPTTLDELKDAAKKLKAKGTPIAVGAKDGWPAGHWYYWFALRACSEDVLNETAESLQFNDPCWTRAGEELEKFLAEKPFQEGFLDMGQEGAGSSKALLASHKASAELMGAWAPGVIAGLTEDKKPLPDLGFFPFVSIPGGEGDPAAAMGGVDAYSCSAWAPDLCAEFLNMLASTESATAYAEAFQTVPANTEAQASIEDPLTKQMADAVTNAPYVSFWLDSLYGQNVGTALNTAVVELFAGKGDVKGIIDAVNNAGAKG